MSDEHASITEKVRRWAAYEKQLKHGNEQMRKARETKTQLAAEISQYLTHHPCAKIEIDGALLYTVEKREYAPLTFTYMETCLGTLIPDESQRDAAMTYLKDHRAVHITHELRTRSTTRGRTLRRRPA